MKTYIVTGATGYIGSSLIRFLLNEKYRIYRCADEDANGCSKIHIFAPVRDMQKALRMFPEGVEFIQMDLCGGQSAEHLSEALHGADYIIHCAAVTKSSEMTAHPVETTESILNITKNILEYAKSCNETGNLKSMVYLSSMEVYGNIDCTDRHLVTEEEVSRGTVDLLSSRSCYPLGKRMAENLCYSFYKEYGVPVKIARLAQTFGRGVLPKETRVFAQFAKAAVKGQDIVLHTKGFSMGNYCGIDDAVKGILTILRNGANGEAYNVVNEANTMTIREMAELVADKIAGGKIRVIYDIPQDGTYGYAPDTGLRLSGRKLMSLGWMPTQGMEEMYRAAMDSIVTNLE